MIIKTLPCKFKRQQIDQAGQVRLKFIYIPQQSTYTNEPPYAATVS